LIKKKAMTKWGRKEKIPLKMDFWIGRVWNLFEVEKRII
jgi:hypothetical protein